MVAQAVSKLDEVHALLVRIADERHLSKPRLDATLTELVVVRAGQVPTP